MLLLCKTYIHPDCDCFAFYRIAELNIHKYYSESTFQIETILKIFVQMEAMDHVVLIREVAVEIQEQFHEVEKGTPIVKPPWGGFSGICSQVGPKFSVKRWEKPG